MRSADSRRHDESDFSVFEFFVELQCVEDLFAREIFRQRRGQLELPEKIDNCIPLIRRQSSPSFGDGARSDNSKAQCFSVQKLAIISRALNRVTNRVTEIQKRALAGPVAFVFRDDPRFDLDVALDQRLQGKRSPRRPCPPGLKRSEHFGVGDDGMLDDLGEALIEFARGQRF